MMNKFTEYMINTYTWYSFGTKTLEKVIISISKGKGELLWIDILILMSHGTYQISCYFEAYFRFLYIYKTWLNVKLYIFSVSNLVLIDTYTPTHIIHTNYI